MTDVPNQAAVAVIIRNDQFLTIKRSPWVRAPGQICFPGGGVEPGESIESAIVREMNEELGVNVVPIKPIWKSVAASGAELNWWRTKIQPGQLICPNPQEVASAQWLRLADIISLPLLLASNLAFFSALERGEIDLD